MNLFGLVGYPLDHSFSKKYFEQKFRDENIADCQYKNFPLNDISEIQALLKTPNLKGLNITIPYKEKVLKYVDVLSEEVNEIKSANTLKLENGKVHAFNTDFLGFTKSLLSTEFDKNKVALILGTGGSSKAIAFALKKLDFEYKFVSRDNKKADYTYDMLNSEIMHQTSLIVNTSPMGMHPNVNRSPNIPYEFLNENHFCYDLVYNPDQTEFLRKSKNQGAVIKNGLEMLILQAEESWKIWNNTK